MTELLYKDEVFQIVGVCMEVHRTLGYGFLEVVYKDAIEIETNEDGIPYEREKGFDIYYKNEKLGRRFYADFFMFDKIITEIKTSSEGISEAYIAQTLNYMKASNTKLGLIINFGHKLEFKRIILE